MSRVSRREVADVIAEYAIKAKNLKHFSRETAAYLLDEGRVGELDPILRDVQDIWARKGYVNAIAVGARPLSDTSLSDVKSKVRALYPNAKHIKVISQTDPNLIGGVRIELANRQLDLSVRSKLNKFKQLSTKGE